MNKKMSMNMTFHVKVPKLNNLSSNVRNRLQEELRSSAILLTNEVKESINGARAEPRSFKTGNFLNSVAFIEAPLMFTVYSDVEYAGFLEYGTTSMEAREHFRNSLMRMRPDIIQKLNNAVRV